MWGHTNSKKPPAIVWHSDAAPRHDREKLRESVESGKMLVLVEAGIHLGRNHRVYRGRCVPIDLQRPSRSSRTAWAIASGLIFSPFGTSRNSRPLRLTSLATTRFGLDCRTSFLPRISPFRTSHSTRSPISSSAALRISRGRVTCPFSPMAVAITIGTSH